MNTLVFALLLQTLPALPARANIENPTIASPLPKQLQKDYDKLWKRFVTGKEDAKVARDLEKLLKKDKDLIPGVLMQFYMDFGAGRYTAAERELEIVLSRRSTDRLALYYLAEMAYARNDYIRASSYYRRLFEVEKPSTEAELRSQRALLLAMENLLQGATLAAQQDRLPESEGLYRQALVLAPQEAALHGLLAAVLQRAGKRDEADAVLRRQADLNGPVAAIDHSREQQRGRAAAELEDLGRWGNEMNRLLEIRSASAITREQLAGLVLRYFPEIEELSKSAQIVTDLEDSWAAAPIQTMLDAGLVDPLANHTYQPARTVSRGEFGQVMARLIRALGLTPSDAPPIAAPDLVPGSTLYRELQLVVGYGLLSLDDSGNFNVAAPVGGEEAVNTAEKLLRLIRKKTA